MAQSAPAESLSATIAKVLSQAVVLADKPSRRDLLRFDVSWSCRKFALRIHRNTPFEFVAAMLPPFLAYAGLEASMVLGDYDDSLIFSLTAPADVELIWLDFERYAANMSEAAFLAWFEERLRVLRSQSIAPVIVADNPANGSESFNSNLERIAAKVPGVRIMSRRAVSGFLGEAFWDTRLLDIGASTVSSGANILLARELGLRWLPAALRPRIKAIAIDLDNTLFEGVLGEDGTSGPKLSPAHKALQERLIALRDEGIFLALVSKNEDKDVERLFAEREDFPLRLEHFTAREVSWDSKSAALSRILDKLRIGADAVLFVDDNIGEIAEVTSVFPLMPSVLASDPKIVLSALAIGPGLLAWSKDAAGQSRINDLEAAAERERIKAENGDPLAYLKALDTRLTVAVNPADSRDRIHSLANKTNQFILALRRPSEAEVAAWLGDKESAIVTLQLTDKLADSGIIGVMFLRREGNVLRVEELCISCRALGRKLEDFMIARAIDAVRERMPASQVTFVHATGPRNGPGRDWLARFSAQDLSESGEITLSWPPDTLEAHLASIPVPVTFR